MSIYGDVVWVSGDRRPTSAGGRVGTIEPLPPGEHRPQDTCMLVGHGAQRLGVADARL